jgi:hypothetical protein
MRNSLTRVAIGLLTASALALLAATPGTADMGGIHCDGKASLSGLESGPRR